MWIKTVYSYYAHLMLLCYIYVPITHHYSVAKWIINNGLCTYIICAYCRMRQYKYALTRTIMMIINQFHYMCYAPFTGMIIANTKNATSRYINIIYYRILPPCNTSHAKYSTRHAYNTETLSFTPTTQHLATL